MSQRGRKSAASLSITPAASLSPPLEPPEAMGAREKAEWCAIVDRMGSAWFPRETHALLRALCGVAIQLNDINEAVTALGPGVPSDPVAWDRYRALTKLRGSVGAQLVSLMTKLRLTTQSRSHPERAYNEARRQIAAADRPWSDHAN